MTDTVTAKLAEWEALVEGATEGPWEAGVEQGLLGPMFVLRAGSGQAVAFRQPFGNVVTPDAEFIAAAPTIATALLGFVREVQAMIRDRHRGIGATSDYDTGHRDGWNDALQAIERTLTEQIGGEGS